VRFFRALVFIEELYYLYSLFGVLYSICGEGGKNVFGGWGFSVRWVLHIVRGIILCGWL